MKTDEFVSLLAAGVAPVPAGAVGRCFAVAIGWGVSGAVLLLVFALGVRGDLAQAAGELMFWLKPAFAACLALAALIAAERLARPDMRLGPVWAALATPVLVLRLVAPACWSMPRQRSAPTSFSALTGRNALSTSRSSRCRFSR